MRESIDLGAGNDGAVSEHAMRARLHPRHSHDELEFNLVVAGSGSYLLPDRREPLRRGAMIWLFPDCEHVLADVSADFRMWIVVLGPAAVRRLVDAGAIDPLLATGNPPGRWARNLSRSALGELTSLCAVLADPSLPSAVRNHGLAWLAIRAQAAFRGGSGFAALSPAHPAVSMAIRVLAEPGPPITARALARRCGLSPDRLARLFRGQVGERMASYRNRLRVERALAQLDAGRRDLTHIALEAGFGSYQQFHRCFVAATGRSPSSWASG